MAGSSNSPPVGHRFESHMREERAKRAQNNERKKRDEAEQRNADINPFPSCGNSRKNQVYEMDAGHYTRPSEAPPTPPASILEASSDGTILDLQRQISAQNASIQGLSSRLQSEQANIRQFRAEILDLRSARRQAIVADDSEEVARLNVKVKGLSQMVEEGIQRERDLERQIEEERSKNREAREQLRQARIRVSELEHDVSVRETARAVPPAVRRVRAEETSGQVADLDEQQRSEMIKNVFQNHMIIERGTEGTRSSTTYSYPSGRSRKHDRQMKKGGYVSMPKGAGKRGILGF